MIERFKDTENILRVAANRTDATDKPSAQYSSSNSVPETSGISPRGLKSQHCTASTDHTDTYDVRDVPALVLPFAYSAATWLLNRNRVALICRQTSSDPFHLWRTAMNRTAMTALLRWSNKGLGSEQGTRH